MLRDPPRCVLPTLTAASIETLPERQNQTPRELHEDEQTVTDQTPRELHEDEQTVWQTLATGSP